MPRTVTVVINPDVSDAERTQVVCDLSNQFRKYYRQTRVEHLQNLSNTIEEQSFRHTETRKEYFETITSLSSKELEHAVRLYAEITESSLHIVNDGEISHSTKSSLAIGNQPPCDDFLRSRCDLRSGEGTGKRKKERQQMARIRIMTRRRRRTKEGKAETCIPAEKPMNEVSSPSTIHDTTHSETRAYIEAPSNAGHSPAPHQSLPENSPDILEGSTIKSDEEKRGAKRGFTHGNQGSASWNMTEWIAQFCDTNIGSKFLEELPDIGLDMGGGNDIETCFSSSENESAQKKPRIRDESTE